MKKGSSCYILVTSAVILICLSSTNSLESNRNDLAKEQVDLSSALPVAQFESERLIASRGYFDPMLGSSSDRRSIRLLSTSKRQQTIDNTTGTRSINLAERFPDHDIPYRMSELFSLLGPRVDDQQSRASLITDHQLEEAASDLTGSEATKGPPVYRSAPKQIIEIHESSRSSKQPEVEAPSVVSKKAKLQKKSTTVLYNEQQSSERRSKPSKPMDSNLAAGYHHGSRKKKHHHDTYYKPITVFKTKSKKKHSYPSHYTYFGKYHEHRSVPSKGSWKFGYKRGNGKHTIEREEHGHKSHFKTEVKWKDKKGKGHHVFDYNHGKKHAYPSAAAASMERPKMADNKLSPSTKEDRQQLG